MPDLCALCLRGKPLCNSHIIPEFFYKPLYDDRHRTRVYKSADPSLQYIQKGIREKLLCRDCEQVLHVFEDYAARVWNELVIPDRICGDWYSVSGLDYLKFKLLMLSVLWRCSIASHEGFEQVRLGPHEERIREMILSGTPGSPTEYAVFGVALVEPETRSIAPILVFPSSSRIDHHIIYHMAFGGVSWQFVVSRHGTLYTDRVSLQLDGTLRYPVIDLRDYVPGERFARKRNKMLRTRGA